MAGEVTIADLNNDGCAEIMFHTWCSDNSGKAGRFFLMDCSGAVLSTIQMSCSSLCTAGSYGWDGVLGAGSIGNIDTTPDLEIVFQTAGQGLMAINLPNSASAKVLWGTGRGDVGRTGHAWQWTAGQAQPKATLTCTTAPSAPGYPPGQKGESGRASLLALALLLAYYLLRPF